jgi:hypothetical protein
MRAQRHLALAVREGISVEALRDYHVMIATGHAAQLYRDPRTSDVHACCMCCKADGPARPYGPHPHSTGTAMRPTQEERTRSVNWLTDRGHGLPAQSVHIEGLVRAGVSTGPDFSALPPAAVFGILALVRQANALQGDAGSTSDDRRAVIDAHAVEIHAPK